MPSVIPSAKSLTLCDAVATREGGRTTLHGLFNSLRIVTFPYSLGHFCAFAQLSHGLGEVETHFEVSEVGADTPLYVTSPRRIEFPNRDFLIQLAVEIRGCTFQRPGFYLVQLFCDDQWVCDTSFQLRWFE